MRKPVQRLAKLKNFYASRRRMPSLGELAGLIGYRSKNAAKYLAARWIESGILAKDSAGRLLPGRIFNPLRILGSVEAGLPSLAEAATAKTLSLDDWLVGHRTDSFLFKISDDSMAGAGILAGDRVILTGDRQPKDGDLVVAAVGRRWVIRFFKQRGHQVILTPANGKYRPVRLQDEPRVAGVVTAVIRKFGD